ncbi:MAG: acyl carrier protein [Firmicutes bacterium]|jgi:acyl carrier protein|nr:acyl carrier protein [Bacillota bacterium]
MWEGGANEVVVFDKVKEIISEQLDIDIDNIILDSTFEEMDADSLDLVELVMALEEEFDIEITDEEIEGIKTVGDVVNHISSKI